MAKLHRYLALLRGINVGGNNIIKKEELKQCFETLGGTHVTTYIQSGNIVFVHKEKNQSKLTKIVEAALSTQFSYKAQARIISYEDYKKIVTSAPKSWGTSEDERHNALFLLEGVQPKNIAEVLPEPKKTLETITLKPTVIFWSISKKDASKTTYMELAKKSVYKQMTIRNSNTVQKLEELLEALPAE